MKISYVLFGLLVAMGLVLGYLLLFVPETAVGHGVVHPDFPSMLQGGDGAVRHASVLTGGAALGVLMILFMVGLLVFGANRSGKVGMEEAVLIGGTVVFVLCFLAVVITYQPYAEAGGGELTMAFPLPTAWMMYGVWVAPVVFIALYMFRFDPWIMSDEETARFLADSDDSGDA